MNPIVKIKTLHPEASVPAYATYGSACFDLHAMGVAFRGEDVELSRYVLLGGKQAVFRTGLKFEVPEGWRMDIYSRSGHGVSHGVRLGNCVGKIDSDYRGEVLVCLRNDGEAPMIVCRGDRIAQAELNPVYRAKFEVVSELSVTERGEGGFGSTGR